MTSVVVLQYNFLNEYLPQYDDLPKRLLRSAFIGFSASAISDTCSNSIRVVKTSKQTATTPITYPEVVKARHLLTDFAGLSHAQPCSTLASRGFQAKATSLC